MTAGLKYQPVNSNINVSITRAHAFEAGTGTGGTTVKQDGKLNLAIRVPQLPPNDGEATYSFVYQKVQSSTGSTFIEL